jgi:hypothetical protein
VTGRSSAEEDALSTSTEEETRQHWRSMWQALATRFKQVAVAWDAGVLGYLERWDTFDVYESSDDWARLYGRSVDGGERMVRWVRVVAMMGVEGTERVHPNRKARLAAIRARARWGGLRVIRGGS